MVYVQLNVRIREDHAARLKAIASDSETSVTSLIRVAIRQLLKQDEVGMIENDCGTRASETLGRSGLVPAIIKGTP